MVQGHQPLHRDREVKGSPNSILRFLAGIPLALRDVRVAVDRPGFTLNPADCEPLATRAALTGSAGVLAQAG